MKVKLKKSKNIPVPLNEKFFKTVPMVDASGNPIPQDPPLTDSFWDKPKNTSTILRKKIPKSRQG